MGHTHVHTYNNTHTRVNTDKIVDFDWECIMRLHFGLCFSLMDELRLNFEIANMNTQRLSSITETINSTGLCKQHFSSDASDLM